MSSRHVVLYHAPRSRSVGTRQLLEELGADYEVHALDFQSGQQRGADYLAVNPMGKVPALMHEGALVTEQAAVALYLGDLYADAGLTPAIGDPLRGPHLRWMVYYGSCFEPALIDRYMKREPAPPSTCPYGDYDQMLKTLTDQLERGPYLLGERYTVADALWGSALSWTTQFGLVPLLPVIEAYIERTQQRPATLRARALDEALAASLDAAR